MTVVAADCPLVFCFEAFAKKERHLFHFGSDQRCELEDGVRSLVIYWLSWM